MSAPGPASPSEEAVFRLGPLREVAPAAIRELLEIASLVSFPTGRVLFNQGDPLSDDAWLLVTGRLSVRVASGMEKRVMADVWPGEIVGEAALYARGRARSATVVTVTPSTALRIPRALLVEHDDQPALVALEQHLLETMAKRIRSTNTLLQRVVLEQRATGHAAAAAPRPGAAGASPTRPSPSRPSPTRPARPAPPERLTLAQRLARWFDTTD